MHKPPNPFVLAPMAGITDMPFRRLMKRLGAGCVISEFVSARGLMSRSPRMQKYLALHKEEFPMAIQIFGDEATDLAEASRIVEAAGADFVDINMGCPVPKVTKKGGGSGWLTRGDELANLFKTVKAAVKIPVTIKIRTGWDSTNLNAPEVVRIAKEEGISWVAIHGRTRTQGYAGSADWSFIREVAQNTDMPIIGNGDLISGPLAAARLIESGCHGVMIGRGALKNPWIFAEAVEAWTRVKDLSPELKQQFVEEVLAHHKVPPAGEIPEGKEYYHRKVKALQPKPVSFTADWVRIRADRDPNHLINEHLGLLREFFPEERALFAFRKFLAWYAAGYPGAHQFRKFIFTTEDSKAVIDEALCFFERVKALGSAASETSEEAPELMSGHG